ncbi:hypothetical protein P1X14_07805 [Sphingomonas sp. AOB5]|uniref:hypothetical protein n=1 Tax=Sphingomonas sp. AOB5 TaxID=3034017 RepID=UPI0023F94AD9|nr:hypothetical protein [Sphingomonas sp. AOB5]MDF7775147.1 hypothetical protein [Sphingomonas sp. AOB5]
MPTLQPIAVFGDTLMLVAALMAARYAIVALRGELGWWGWSATWLRRVSAVAVLILALRLASIAAARPEIAGQVSGFALVTLLAGAALIAADHWITRLVSTRSGQS